MAHFFTVEVILKMALDLGLGICIKLLCDNGRIHWKDFANDILFWLPNGKQEAGDGLGRQVAAMQIATVASAPEVETLPLAAK